MFKAEVTIKNKTGLHARPASALVALCQKFESQILLVGEDIEADPKSIISLLSAGIKQGTTVVLQVEGPDEETAGKKIIALIDSLTE